MSDPALSEEPSALLARIAALEQKIGLLSIGMPITAAPRAETDVREKAPVSKSETISHEEQYIPAVKKEEKNTSGLRQLPYWLELVESLSKQSRSAMGLRDGSKAYKDAENDRILIKFGNSFTMKLMSEDSAKHALAAMISAREGRAYSTDKLVYALADKQELANDDLLDTLEE